MLCSLMDNIVHGAYLALLGMGAVGYAEEFTVISLYCLSIHATIYIHNFNFGIHKCYFAASL